MPELHGTRPSDGGGLPPVPSASAEDVRELIARARRAAEVQASRSLEDRVERVRAFGRAVFDRKEKLVALLRDECGKPEAEAWLHEVLPTADLVAYWSDDGARALLAEEPELDALTYPGKRALIERLPRGVVGLVTPWNYPVALPLRTLFPALVAGNAVVLKPSELTPRTALVLVDAANEAFGEDAVVAAVGAGDVGEAVIRGGVDAVIFTGSVDTGRKVAHAAADALVPVSLELGGKDAAVVLEDAALERTARGVVWGAMTNAGQNCASIERVYVVAKIADAFERRACELTRELALGRDVGPLVSERQLATVVAHVDDAVSRGATAAVGGARVARDGFWFAPTVLTNVPDEARVLREETFGPVLPVVRVASAEDAIERANRSPFGLTGSVWTRDLARGEALARRLRAGVVVVDNHAFTGAIPSLPWTGVGASGYGVTNSTHALDVLTRPRAVVVDGSRGKSELWWYPYTPGLARAGRGLSAVRGGRLGKALAGIPDVLAGLAKRNRVT